MLLRGLSLRIRKGSLSPAFVPLEILGGDRTPRKRQRPQSGRRVGQSGVTRLTRRRGAPGEGRSPNSPAIGPIHLRLHTLLAFIGPLSAQLMLCGRGRSGNRQGLGRPLEARQGDRWTPGGQGKSIIDHETTIFVSLKRLLRYGVLDALPGHG